MPYHVFTTICPTLDIENRVDNQGVDFINASGLRGTLFVSSVYIDTSHMQASTCA